MSIRHRVTLFTAVGCPACRSAKSVIRRMGIDFLELDCQLFVERYRHAASRAGIEVVPLIFAGDDFVGGSRELESMVHRDGMQNLRRQIEEKSSPTISWLSPIQVHETDAISQLVASKPFPTMPKLVAEQEFSTETFIFRLQDATVSGLQRAAWSPFGPPVGSFSAVQLVHAITRVANCPASEAAAMAKRLLLLRVVVVASAKSPAADAADFSLLETNALQLRFVVDFAERRVNSPLNALWTPRMTDDGFSEELVISLNRHLLQLLDEFCDERNVVNFEALKTSENFERFSAATAYLQRAALDEMSVNSRKALYINAYNMAVIHGHAVFGPPKGVVSLYSFFNNVKYNIGGYIFSLNELENGLLRGNRRGVAAVWKPWVSSDSKLRFAVSPMDFRIHFALNCGAASCPPIRTFTAAGIEEELQQAAKTFVRTFTTLDESQKTLRTSKIILWYKADFGTDPTETLLPFLEEETQKAAAALKPLQLEFEKYDWSSAVSHQSRWIIE